MIASALLATVPWAVLGLVYSVVVGGVGTEVMAILMWTVIGAGIGAAMATAPEEDLSRQAVRSGAAIGMIISLAWGAVFYFSASTVTRSGLGPHPGLTSGPLTLVLVGRIGNFTVAASGILGLIKGAIVGSSAAAIYHRFFAKKKEQEQ